MGSSKKSKHRHRDESDEEADDKSRSNRRRNRSRDRSKERNRSRSPHDRRTKDKHKSKRERSGSPHRRDKRERSGSPHRRDKRERSGSPHRRDKRERSGSPHRRDKRKRSGSPHRRTKRERSGSGDRRKKDEGSHRAEERLRRESQAEVRSSNGGNKSPQNSGGADSEPPKVTTSGDAISLSIEETNKLRVKLGLKPLQVDSKDANSTQAAEGEEAPKKKEDVHAPPKNIGQLKASEKLKEKMSAMSETRKNLKKLGAVQTLADSGSEGEDDTTSWVRKMRQKEEQKKAAEKKAQMLAEMDEEFGVGEIVSSSQVKGKEKAYSAADLQGLAVEHSTAAFKEGRDVILTLKDSKILDEEDDVLMNVNIVDSEKAIKNIENKKNARPNPYDQQEEMDEYGNVHKPTLLDKYDEEIEGEKKKSFTLGISGEVDTSEEARRRAIREQLQSKQISLETGPSHIASEYYTSEEMVAFKKPKKKRKVRKKLKADDLLPLGDSEHTKKDHGSRGAGSKGGLDESMEVDPPPDPAVDLRDEDSSAVETALEKTRRLMRRGRDGPQGAAAKVTNMLQSMPSVMVKQEPTDDDELPEGTIVLDTTAEFCRQVGEDEGKEQRRVSTADNDDEFGIDDTMMEVDNPQFDSSEGGWSEVNPSTEKKPEPQAEDLYQEAEPMASSSVIAALQIAAQKGFIPHRKKDSSAGGASSSTQAQRDIDYERQKERERERELSKYERDGSFPEKKGYKPNVRIIHVDDSGRELDIKGAFRFLSHKFHGKGSGKKKLEKRMKKIQEEQFLKTTSSIDTPLNTLAMLKTKQQKSQSPYIVLKGAGAQSLQAPDVIGKRK